MSKYKEDWGEGNGMVRTSKKKEYDWSKGNTEGWELL
jgi:hypothetical protein